jgi:hypothetical protein
MKLNTLFLFCAGLVPVIALSGSNTANEACIPCLVAPDTLPQHLIDAEIKTAIDSMKRAKVAQLQEAQETQDTIAVQLGLMQRFRNKKLVLYSVDTVDSIIYRSYYWQYRGGRIEPFRTIKQRL